MVELSITIDVVLSIDHRPSNGDLLFTIYMKNKRRIDGVRHSVFYNDVNIIYQNYDLKPMIIRTTGHEWCVRYFDKRTRKHEE